jgi:uncharacterized protein YqjF (DUF2071 family)
MLVTAKNLKIQGNAITYHSKKQSASKQSSIILHQTRASRNDTPQNRDGSNEARWRKFLQHEVGWHLEDKKRDEEYRDSRLKVLADETQVGFHPVETRISDVDSAFYISRLKPLF